MEKKYFITPVILIMFIASCSFTTVEQEQNGLEDQEVISSEVTLSEPKAELSRTLVI